MPCWTVTRTSVEFKAEHFELLEAAAKELGFRTQRSGNSLSFYTSNGTVVVRDGQINVDERDRKIIDPLKRAYSEQVLKKASSRYGWALKKTTENTFVVQKR